MGNLHTRLAKIEAATKSPTKLSPEQFEAYMLERAANHGPCLCPCNSYPLSAEARTPPFWSGSRVPQLHWLQAVPSLPHLSISTPSVTRRDMNASNSDIGRA